MYDQTLGRFLQRDPLGSASVDGTTVGRPVQREPVGAFASFNLYEYVRSDPINLTDSTGKRIDVCCRPLTRPLQRFGHCYLKWTCFGQTVTFGLYPQFVRVNIPILVPGTPLPVLLLVPMNPWIGYPRINDPNDQGGTCTPCTKCSNLFSCLREILCLLAGHVIYPRGIYNPLGPNSNTYASWLSTRCCPQPPQQPPGQLLTPGWNAKPPEEFPFARRAGPAR
jgi:RHS repeat-associated protein